MTLWVEDWGQPGSPRVVCLHGVTGRGRLFARLAADALAEYHVLAPDLLGHGSSSYEPPWNIEAHLDAIVQTVGIEPAVLIGHSFGGRLAYELAARAPKLVPRLILLDPAIYVPPNVSRVAAENARLDRSYVSFAEGVDRRFDESQLYGAPRERVEEDLAGHLVLDEDGRYRYRYSQSAVVTAYGEVAVPPPPFEKASVPTLLVLGERSYLPYDHLLEAHQAALGDLLQVVVVAGGHSVLWDALEETSAAIASFLAGYAQSSAATAT